MLTVLMPSRGRERQAKEAYESFLATKVRADTEMLIVLDEDEPGYDGLPAIRVAHEQPGMGPAINAALAYAAPEMYGFCGDDHRFRTHGWDAHVVAANGALEGGFVYGNDLFQGENLPTAVFVDARITDALGWIALPGATHLYLDNAWLALGRGLNRLIYLPEVVIEHVHPAAGKAQWDAAYLRVNDPSVYGHDSLVYGEWINGRFEADIAKVREALR